MRRLHLKSVVLEHFGIEKEREKMGFSPLLHVCPFPLLGSPDMCPQQDCAQVCLMSSQVKGFPKSRDIHVLQ